MNNITVGFENKGFSQRITRIGNVSKRVHKQIEAAWHRCVRKFIKATTLRMVVDSGMSQASLLPLANFVNLTMHVSSKPSVKGLYPGWTDIDGIWHTGEMKSKTLGRRLGQKPTFNVLTGSSVRPVLYFEFNIIVYQHAIHELGLGGTPSWNSLVAGEEAFFDEWDALDDKLPDIARVLATGGLEGYPEDG